MIGRSFADYTLRQKLRIGFCGDAYRAVSADGTEVRITHLAAPLAKSEAFAAAVVCFGNTLKVFKHDHVVTTRVAGRTAGGGLFVVSDAVLGRVDVAELLADASPSPLPQEIATAISHGFMQGLAAAHAAGIVHGAVNPRCVVINAHGAVKLGDFAIARALGQVCVSDPSSPLYTVAGGYLAPEVRRQQAKPSPAADVYGAAAVAYHILSGSLPPGTLDISPGFERMIQRALDTDLSRRYSDAGELLENFVEALEDDNWVRATPSELATFVMEAQSRMQATWDEPSAAAALDEATEDLLSIIGGPEAGHGAQVPHLPGDFVLSSGGREDARGDSIDSIDAELDPPTQVSSPFGPPTADPIMELIALSEPKVADGAVKDLSDSAETEPITAATASDPAGPRVRPAPAVPLPLPADSPGDTGREPGQAASLAAPSAVGAVPEPVPATGDLLSDATGDAAGDASAGAATDGPSDIARDPAPAQAETARPARPAKPAPDLDAIALQESLMADMLGKKRNFLRTFLWGALALAGIGALIWVVYSQAVMREKHAEQEQRLKAENEAALAAFRAAAPKEGTVVVHSEPDAAAVWLSLGRTPTVSRQVSTAMLHELRLELDGHKTVDVRIEGSQWTGDSESEAMQATMTIALTAGDDARPVPAYPPEPPASAQANLREGKGHIHVKSDPPGAQVWLLVGITPGVKYEAQARADYEFKIVRDGYLPGFVSIKADDWKESSAGTRVSRTVKLVPRSKRRGRKSK